LLNIKKENFQNLMLLKTLNINSLYYNSNRNNFIKSRDLFDYELSKILNENLILNSSNPNIEYIELPNNVGIKDRHRFHTFSRKDKITFKSFDIKNERIMRIYITKSYIEYLDKLYNDYDIIS
jgi:hypothetical protein